MRQAVVTTSVGGLFAVQVWPWILQKSASQGKAKHKPMIDDIHFSESEEPIMASHQDVLEIIPSQSRKPLDQILAPLGKTAQHQACRPTATKSSILVCIYIYIYMYSSMHIYIYIHVCGHMCAGTCVRAHAYTPELAKGPR